MQILNEFPASTMIQMFIPNGNHCVYMLRTDGMTRQAHYMT